ncbi:MAG TPA: DoxX family protein [Terriglobia bacterium]|nr:DoxX family protein [Terriglobia bacterium]
MAATCNEELIDERFPAKVFMQVDRRTGPSSKKMLWGGRILSALPVLFLLFDGVIKLMNVAPVVEAQSQLGIPQNLTLPIGILELACVLVYAIPSTAFPGAILLTGYLGGAIAIQVRAASPLLTHVLFPVYVGALLWGGLYLRDERLRQLIRRRPGIPRNDASRGNARRVSSASSRMNGALWIVQVLLALLFLFAGSTKLILPIDVLASMGSPNQIALPGLFIRFIGVAEVLGAIGLILPWLLRIRPRLTPVAAAGLVIIMIGATSLTLAVGDVAGALIPFVVGLLSSFVAYGRWRAQNNQGARRSIAAAERR